MPTSGKTIESPYQSILAWSNGTAPRGATPWPAWQRDALRRIVLNGQLSPADLDELALICKAAHGLKPTAGEVPTAIPLSADHIASGPDAASSVSLVKLAAMKNVNRLVGDPPLEFGPSPGLTIVFGDNGTGKSGYARVIKNACRARGAAQAIKPNAFDAASHGPATADIVCSVGPAEVSLKWTDGVPTDPRLSNIFVFDAVSARLYVNEDGPASFTPRGLDVLPKLAHACDDLRAKFKGILDAITTDIGRLYNNWTFTATTTVGTLIGRLGAGTKEADIEAAATFTDEDRKRLRELTDALKSDPKQKAQATAAAASFRSRGSWLAWAKCSLAWPMRAIRASAWLLVNPAGLASGSSSAGSRPAQTATTKLSRATLRWSVSSSVNMVLVLSSRFCRQIDNPTREQVRGGFKDFMAVLQDELLG